MVERGDQKSSRTTWAQILGLAPRAHSPPNSGQQNQKCPYSQSLKIKSRHNHPIKESGQRELWNILELTPFPQLQGSASPTKLIHQIQMQIQSACCPRKYPSFTHDMIPEIALAQQGCPCLPSFRSHYLPTRSLNTDSMTLGTGKLPRRRLQGRGG